MVEKVGSIQAWHDHFKKTQVWVMDKVSTMESWMTKFDSNLSTMIRILSRLEPLLPNLQVPPKQKLFV
jgi:hypothetical protein